MQYVHEIIEQVTNTLSDIAQSDVVVGAPLVVGTNTVVPISRVMAGFGGGGGAGDGAKPDDKKGQKGSGRGEAGGSGGGAIVRPVAVVVFGEQGVKVLSIAERQNKLEKFLEQIPELVDKFRRKDDDKPSSE